VYTIEETRATFIAETREFLRQRDVGRFGHAFDQDRVVIDVNTKLPNIPSWDNFENNHFAMRRRLVGIWLRAANLLITRNRAGRRLTKIKLRLKQENIRTRADARRLVI
jgi:hypothetical protein